MTKGLIGLIFLLSWWVGLSQSNPYIQVLPNGNVSYQISFPTARAYVEVFAQKNNLQIVAQDISASGVLSNGTYTYSYISAASNYVAGDQLKTRFYSFTSGGPGVFTPGPAETNWSDILTYSTNTLPIVSITSPTTNASFTAPATISINATASDANGSVSKVEFFNGATKLGEDITSPYTFSWTSVAAGTYTITAKATDNLNATKTSTGVTVVVSPNQLPTVSITSPVNNRAFIAPATIAIAATASDAGGSVSKVEFFNGTTKIGEDLTSPYTFSWTNVAVGTYSLTAKATDNLNATKTSAIITVVVNSTNQLPNVSITSPAMNATFVAPGTIAIAATASDVDGSVSKVEFFNGATKIGEDLTSPFTFSWTSVAAGTYTITAKATDNLNATKTSTGVTVVVNPNQLPNVNITSPVNNATFVSPATIVINATATDADGSVAKVEFFNGATKLGEDATVPFSFSWSNVAAGTYTITAKATDNRGGTKTSAGVMIVGSTNQLPNVNITSPATNATFVAPATINIAATATDADGSVSKVEFFNGATKLGEDATVPFSFSWTNVNAGTYTITAKATDNRGGIKTSAAVTAVVNNATTEIKGLTVLVEYSDAPFLETEAEVAAMLNQPGYTGWDNVGSVRDFYYTQSNGKVTYTSTVIKVSFPFSYNQHYGPGAPIQDLADITAAIRQKYPSGFQNLSLKPDNSVIHFSIMNKAPKGAWAFGPQPGNNTITNNGALVDIKVGNIITYGSRHPDVSVVCHEMGHNIYQWTDYYQTAFSNLGNYCAMASAGSPVSPMQLCPPLRFQKNWINTIIEIGNTTQTYHATSNSYSTIYKYTNPTNPKEYLLIHPQVQGPYYLAINGDGYEPDQGLAIYYVDEEGGMDLPGSLHWLIKLLQADNLDEMHSEYLPHHDRRGDLTDLYDNIYNSFPNGTPFRWKDGGEFGLSISNISAPGATMSFTVNARPNTFIATSDKNGKISPAGVISANNSEVKTFTFTPYPGYEIDQVKVNGTVTAVSGNTLNITAGGTKTVQVTYRRKATLDPLPQPWQHTDVGSTGNNGVSGINGNEFYLEYIGSDIWGNWDNCRFVYQPLNGDGSIQGRLTFSNRPQDWSKVGLMIRENLQPNSAYSMMMYTPRNQTPVQYRTSNGGFAEDIIVNGASAYDKYKWYKITRNGNIISNFCSVDAIDWVLMAEVSIPMTQQVLVGMAVTGGFADQPCRATFDNVTVNGVCTVAGTKLSGTVIGTAGSWNNSGNTREKAFDGNVNTFFDAPEDIAWTGLSLGSAYSVNGIRYYPREGATDRMVGGKFQGSNTADFTSGAIDLATILVEPALAWNCIPVSNTTGFRYLRYLGPAGGVGNVSEVEFYGTFKNARATTDFVEEEKTGLSSRAYPNPFDEQTTIEIPEESGEVEISVYNATGDLITKETASNVFVMGNRFENGFYLIKIVSASKTETFKVLKQKN